MATAPPRCMLTGADPEIEEGGGHTYRVGIGAVRVGRSCLCAH